MAITILFWLIASFVIGAIGANRRIGFIGSFFVSLIFSPVIGIIVTLLSSTNEDADRQRELIALNKQQADHLKGIGSKQDISSQLSEISRLKDAGHLTEGEYQQAKNKILNTP